MKYINLKNAVLLSAVSCVSAYATVISPGSPTPVIVQPSSVTVAGLGTLTLVDSVTAAFNSGGFVGSLETAVYETNSGTLDFFYQVRQTAADTRAIATIDVPIDDMFGTSPNVVNADFLSSVAGLSQPSSPFASSSEGTVSGSSRLTAAWQAGNDAVDFSPVGLGAGTLVTTVLVLTTTAKDFQDDDALIAAGTHSANDLATFSPFVATPEPGFYGVLALGLSGLAFAVVRRRSAEKLGKS